ncbi:MAG TPA: hypothetical protein VHO06_13890, partial [Polyangia bacterium]|nr:hypothetical protein [Polyangia bacterium]
LVVAVLLGLVPSARSAFAADGGTSAVAADGGAPVGPPAAVRSRAEVDARALEKERPACEAGDLGSCLWGSSRPQPEGDRLKLLERACQLGPRGCVDLAYALAGGYHRVPLDLPRARELAGRLCSSAADAIEAGACLVLAQITPEPAQIPHLLGRACDLDWSGYRGDLYTNYWLPPGQPPFQTNCRDRARLGKPVQRRSRSRP